MKIALGIARIVLGLAFFVFGLNGFFHFLPMPADVPVAAQQFGAALGATGYMWPFVKGTEVLVGLMLLSNRLVPLALVVLMPVMLNIMAFHLFLEPPQTVALPVVLFGLQLFLAWNHRAAYRSLLAVTPAGRKPADFGATSGVLVHQ